MTRVSVRRRPRLHPGLGLVAVCVLASRLAGCYSAQDLGITQPSGVIGIVSGGGSGSGGTLAGTYRLHTFRGSAPPLIIFYDSTVGVHDSLFSASFDSSFISLNSDSSVRQLDYLTVRDIRTDSSVNRTVRFGDTTAGTWSASGTTITVTRVDTVGGFHHVITQYAAANSAVTGLITYSLFNTGGGFVKTDTATVVYDLTGAPVRQLVGPEFGRGSGSSAPSRPQGIRPPKRS